MLMLCFVYLFFLFKQKTAYEMRIRDWSSDVCSSDLDQGAAERGAVEDLECDGSDVDLDPVHGAASIWRDGRSGCDAVLGSAGPFDGDGDRKSVVSGKSVSVRVDLGGRRIINNKNK